MNGDTSTYTVSELTGALRRTLEAGYRQVTVRGEISNLRRPSSGHLYFALKDDSAQLRAVMFRGSATGLRFAPADGVEVEAEGEISLYEPRGDLQLIVRRMVPSGVGALMQAYEQLKRRLAEDGLFAPERKRPLPAFPAAIAVITSGTGAALRDILHVLARRWPMVRVVVLPVRVQGDGAAAEIAAAVEQANRWGKADVLIVGRGGGSLEDLWAFNEEVVARAIVASRIPVVSAVGHEIDVTIADLAADLRAPTPSAAAELVVPDAGEWSARMRRMAADLDRLARDAVETRRQAVMNVASAYGFRRPDQFLRREEQRVDEWWQRLQRAMVDAVLRRRAEWEGLSGRLRVEHPKERVRRERLTVESLGSRMVQTASAAAERRRGRLTGLDRALGALNPGSVLTRGYCLVRNPQSGALHTSALELEQGARVVLQFSEDRALGQVSSVERGGPPELEPAGNERS